MHFSKERGIDEQRSAACGASRFSILPFITDDKRAVQIEMPLKRGFDEQSRFWLATGATIRFVMWTNQDIVQVKSFAQYLVHAIQFPQILVPEGDHRLIGRRN